MMPTLKEVAALAEVSLFSASKVLNGTWREARIGESCAERVQAAAAKLGYAPNYHARSLIRGRAQTLGLVLREPRHNDTDFAGALMAGIEEHLAQREHDLLLVGRRRGGTEIEHGLDCLRQQRVDALIVPGQLGEMIWTDEFEAAEGPIVLAVAKPGSAHPAVDVDATPGIGAAVRHLAELGHREVLWLAPAADDAGVAGEARRKALVDAAAELGMRCTAAPMPPLGGFVSGDDRSEAARRHAAGVLTEPFAFTAAMCFNDQIALGLCRAANDRGLRVPRDFSVVGFDDLQSRQAVPRLTTVSHELPAIGARAAELAIALAEDRRLAKRLRGRVERLPARLIVRESTAPPRSRP
jgi:LacI family transcriptional regulator